MKKAAGKGGKIRTRKHIKKSEKEAADVMNRKGAKKSA
jgi:hypothetical protein